MMLKTLAPVAVLWSFLFATISGCEAMTQISTRNVPRMTIDELKARMNDPALVLIDVRSAEDWKKSKSKIKGAIREDDEKVKAWAPKYPTDKVIVLYCA